MWFFEGLLAQILRVPNKSLRSLDKMNRLVQKKFRGIEATPLRRKNRWVTPNPKLND